jgi:alkylhydroperoxidase family enzyme
MNNLQLGQPLNLRHIFTLTPDLALPIMGCFEHMMRDASALSPAERELIYSYTSAVNNVHFCAFSHRHCAIGLGIPEAVFDTPRHAINSAAIPDDARVRLTFACSLQMLEHEQLASAARALSAQSKEAREDTIRVVGLTAFMNRLIDGLGAVSPDESHVKGGKSLAEFGYRRVSEDVERMIIEAGNHPAQTLQNQPQEWASAPTPFYATLGWVNSLKNYVLVLNSGVPFALRAAIMEAIREAAITGTGGLQRLELANDSENALFKFAVAVGVSTRRSVPEDFTTLRSYGWTNDRDIIDAVLVAAVAACSARIEVGAKHLNIEIIGN